MWRRIARRASSQCTVAVVPERASARSPARQAARRQEGHRRRRHSILVIAYHVLRDSQSYRELGGDYFDRLNTDRLTRYHTKRLAATR